MWATSTSADQLISIKSVTLHRVRVPLIEPFRISNGEVAEKDAILIEMTTAEGTVGWGEASPMCGSFYSDDTPDSTWEVLSTQLIPILFELKALDPAGFYSRLRQLPGESFAKAGVEGALWDCQAQTLGLPLYKLLGIRPRPISSGVAIGIFDQVEELLDRVRMHVDQGYQRVKIKIQPGWDIDPVSAVREHFPEVPLMVDANAAYTFVDQKVFKELDRFELTMIEQPLAREAHEEAGELQRTLRTPLCADESADSLDALRSLIKNEAARIINIKVQRVGGLSEALMMHDSAQRAGLQCWVGTMPELGVASAQGLHLATHQGFTFPTDIEASMRWYADDVIEPLIEIDSKGFIHLPDGVGTGYTVSREKVEKYSSAVEHFAV